MFKPFNKWTFVPCTTPSHAREKMVYQIKNGKGSEFRFVIKWNTFGYEWR